MEWFITSLKAIPPNTVANCWIACKILTLNQMHDLETGIRHGYRDDLTRAQATAGVSQEVIDELSSLLMNLGKSLAVNKNYPLQMIEAVDLLDLEAEREVFDMCGPGDEIEDEEDEVALPLLEGENNVINLSEVGEVDEQEPMPTLSLAQAKQYSERLFNFVSENNPLIMQAGTSRSADYVSMADSLRFAINRMSISNNTRQTSISEFMTGSTSTR
jgi:hypothetical protein